MITIVTLLGEILYTIKFYTSESSKTIEPSSVARVRQTKLERKRTKKQKHINRGLPTCGGTIKVNQKHNRGRGLPTCGGTIKVNQKHNRGEPANLWRNDRSEPTATETNRLSKATIRNRNICGRNRNICGIYLKRRRNIVSRLAG